MLRRRCQRHAARLRAGPVAGAPARAVRPQAVRRAPTPQALRSAARSRARPRCSRGPRHERDCLSAALPQRLLMLPGARLPAAAQALAGQRLPLRADLLGLRARGAGAARRAAGSYLTARPPAALPPLVRRRPRSGARAAAAPVHALGLGERDSSLRQEDAPMTDIRRTLLWVVFTMSLVLLWDAWNKHNGQPSIFGAARARRPPAPASRPAPAAAPAAGVPAAGAAAVPGAAPPRRRCRLPAPSRRPPAASKIDGHHRRGQGHLRQPGRHAGAPGAAELQDRCTASGTSPSELFRRRPSRAPNVVLFDAERQARLPGADRPDHRAARRHAAQPPDADDAACPASAR